MKKLLLLLPFVTFCFQVSATQFYWVGASGANWSVATNWKMGGFTGSVATTHPRTSSDSAYMGNGSTNATITLDSSFSIRALFFLGSGQIFVNGAGKRLTISGDFNTSANTGTTGGGTAVIRMAGGTITGNATSEDVGKLPNLLLTGSCSLNGLITMGGSTTFYDSSATISAGTSTVVFYYNDSIKGYPSLNNVEFQGNAAGFVVKDSLLVNGNLNISGSSSWTVNTGTVIALGNIAITCTGSGSYGTGTIRLAGGSSQTISSSAARTQGSLPNVVIAKSGGTLSLSGTISVAGSWANNYSGTINAGTSEVDFKAYYITSNIGGLYPTTFYNLTLEGAVSTYNFTIDSAAIVTNLLLFEGNSALICSNHSVVVRGNVSITNTNNGDGGGNTTFFFKGAKNQTITSTVGRTAGGLPFVVIAKDSGTLSLSGVISICQGWTNNYSSTQVIPGTSEVYLYGDYHTIAIGGLYSTTFYNLTLEGLSSTYNFSIDSAAIVTNLLLIEGSGGVTLSNHSVVIKGNVSITNTDGEYGGSTTCIFNGNRHQTITSTVARGQCGLMNVVIAKSDSLLSLIGTVNIMGGWTNNYSATGISAGTSEVDMNGNWGTLSVGGLYTTTFYNLTLEGIHCTYNFTIDSAAIVTNQLLMEGNANMTLSNYSMVIKGNLEMNNSTATISGNTILYLCGSNNQQLLGSSALTLGNLVINKPAGAFTLNKALSIATSLTLTRGVIVSLSNLLTINNGATVTGASDSSFVSGPVAKAGNQAFRFPVGDTTAHLYKPISISAPSTTSDAFTAQYYNTGIADGLDGVLTYADPCEYWNIAHTTGSSAVHDTLFWNNPCFHIASLSYFKIGYVSGSTWTSVGTCTTSGTTTTGAIASSFVAGNVTLAKTNPLVYAHAGNDTAVCSGLSTTIGASTVVTGGTSPFTYSWSPATGLSSSTSATPTATPTVTTTYILTVTDANNEYGKDTVNIIVDPKLVINAGSDVRVCQLSELTAGGSPTASGGSLPYNYLWTNNSGDTISSSPNFSVVADTLKIYYLRVTDSMQCTSKDTLNIYVNKAPYVKAGPDTLLFKGQTVTLSSIVTGGTSPFIYSWSPALWLSDSTSANPVCHPLSSAHYELVVTDSAGCVGQSSAVINFQPINLGALNNYAAFGDSILVSSNSIAIGNVGSRNNIDTSILRVFGSIVTDSSTISAFKSTLTSIISRIDTMKADTISSNLSGVTLTSGVYRIDTTAFLNGTLTLSGNDSSYFILDIDGDWNVADNSKIIVHDSIDPHKVIFSVNGKIQMGDSLTLNGTFLNVAGIKIKMFTGSAAMLTANTLSILNGGHRLESSQDVDLATCTYTIDLTGVDVPVNGLNKPGYVLVFDDEFNTGSFNTNNWAKWFNAGGNYLSTTYANPTTTNENYPSDPNNLLLRVVKQTAFCADGYGYSTGYGYFGENEDGSYTCHPFTGATIATALSNLFYHGYYEIRSQFPSQAGMYDAFWMVSPYTGHCQDYREIDWFDQSLQKNEIIIANIWHDYITCNGAPCNYPPNMPFICDGHAFYCPYKNGATEFLYDGFHVFGGEWTSGTINYYLDNVLAVSLPNLLTQHSVDERMFVDIGAVVTPFNETTDPYNTTTGTRTAPSGIDPGRDFAVDYMRVWQKVNHVFDYYFVDDDSDGITYTPNGYLPSDLCPDKIYHVQTSSYAGATYNWACSAGITFKMTCSGSAYNPDGNSECYFCVTGTGFQYVELNGVLPSIAGDSIYAESQVIEFHINDAAPSSVYLDNFSGDPYGCGFGYCVDPVSDAVSYQWSLTDDFSAPDFESTAPCYGDFSIYAFTAYPDFYPISYAPPIYVRAVYVNDCGDSVYSAATYYAGGYATVFCPERLEDTSKVTKPLNDSITNLVKVYPSPSDGHLWIENGLGEKIVVTLETTSGATVSTFILDKEAKTQMTNLPEGMIIMQAWKDNDHKIAIRKLIPVINP